MTPVPCLLFLAVTVLVPSQAPASAADALHRGQEALAKKDYDGAIAALGDALPTRSEGCSGLRPNAGVYEVKGDPDKAIADCTEALARLDPKHVEAYLVRAGLPSGGEST